MSQITSDSPTASREPCANVGLLASHASASAIVLSWIGPAWRVRYAGKSSAILAATSLMLLSACETIPPPPQKVSIPIGVSCLPSTMPARPAIATEAELALLDDYKWTLAIFLDRRALLDYSAELEAVLGACK